MNKISKITKVAVLALFASVVIAAPTYAALSDCFEGGSSGKYPNLALSEDGSVPDGYPVRCQQVQEPSDDGYTYYTIYAKSSADCAQAGQLAANPDDCKGGDLNNMIRIIINTVIFAVGMVAVVMIILGGVNYATSQGDSTKVKKAKDTILYGIIGLVISLLAYAIVTFVLSSIVG